MVLGVLIFKCPKQNTDAYNILETKVSSMLIRDLNIKNANSETSIIKYRRYFCGLQLASIS